MQRIGNRLWFKLFIRLAAVFAVFVAILFLANATLLVKFFCYKEKNLLREQTVAVGALDFGDQSAVLETLAAINEKYNFDVEIYSRSGTILYTTYGSQMMDYFSLKNNGFSMLHEEMVPTDRQTLEGGIVFERAVRRFDGSEYLLCRKQISEDLFAEVRAQMQLISNSADIANEFIVMVSLLCFLISVAWVLIFSRRFSKPIAEMNQITRRMAALDFDRKLDSGRKDEIGQLAVSVNELSDSLSAALTDLKTTNEKLKDDIELERRLDAMRRGFVANVSHELKTPIAIISGYAEGLKLDVNPASREEYCNTILDESRRMNRLVLSILELSRYESGQIPLCKQTFSLYPLCEDMLKRIFSGKPLTYCNLVPEDTEIYADPLQTEQALKAFLENAAVHTPPGGTVRVEAQEKDGIVRISVFNSGSHIDDDQMPRIWESFFRGDASRSRESDRFGLGLSIVAAVMKLHHRSCGVFNTEDGVCFWFEADSADNGAPEKQQSP